MIVSRTTLVGLITLAAASCTPWPYRPSPDRFEYVVPVGSDTVEPTLAPQPKSDASTPPSAESPTAEPPAPSEPSKPLALGTVLDSVTSRYPPLLSALLERDLATGRLTQAMGSFDAQLSAKVGDRVQGFYETTVAEGLIEQPLATGDSVYGGYRWSDGFLPDYYDPRTQSGGELVFGARVPILRGRETDKRRASVRKAEIGVELAEPKIQKARIEFVQAASRAYYGWVAAGRKLVIARDLLKLATDRQAGLQRAVDRQFLAPIVLTDNEQLIMKRNILVAKAERGFQRAALLLSLYLRTGDDRPIVADEKMLPAAAPLEGEISPAAENDLVRAFQNRPEVRALELEIDKTETERALAENDRLPSLDLVVEGSSSLSNGPYKDREDLELFIGGELKMPAQRRAALGRMQRATAELARLRLEQQFLRDKILNEILDVRSAARAALQQLAATQRSVELADTLVKAEQRKFDLGRSDLLRIQLRETELANAQATAIDARFLLERALVDYRAVLGGDAR